ncbi:MAG: hypothetical protein KDJ77_17920 [Rhodobiaceae bacterium]|nr:hypothetical protein [Rhodobiaceae bacterium]
MDNKVENLSQDAPQILHRWGFWAVLVGAVALTLVFAQMVGPSFEPRPSVGTQIGEIAGDIRRSAWRSFFGLPNQTPEAASPSIWMYVAFAAPILGIAAVVLSVISGVLRENWRFPACGIAFGVAAIVFQYFWWIALVVAGVVILAAIIGSIGEIFSF